MEPKYNKTAIAIASEIILSEQITTPDKRGSVSTKSSSKKRKDQPGSNARKIAQQIYDSKGVLWDDEESAIKAIQKIKNVELYKEVLKALQNLTGGRGIGQYLSSFTTVPQRLDIVNHLASFIPKSQWQWSVEKIMPWSDFKYSGSKIYSDATAGQNNAKTKLIAYYSDKGLWKGGGPNIDTEFWKDYHHEILMGAEALAYLIPVPVLNVAVATAIAGIDAKMYWDEGDRYSAGLMATLTAIPLIGSLAKLGLKPLIKSLGKNGLQKFISNLKLIKAGQKPALTKTEQELIKKMGSDGNRKLIQQEVNAYYKKLTASKAGKVAGGTAGQIAKTYATIVAAEKAWDPIYVKAGLQLADIQDAAKPLLNKIKNTVINSSTKTESITTNKLKQLVLEEYVKLLTEATSPFATTVDSDRFRNWMYTNYPQQSKTLDVDKTGPKDSPQLIKAYETYKKEYNAWLDVSGYPVIETIPEEGDGELNLSDITNIAIAIAVLKTLASGVLGFFGVRWARGKIISKQQAKKILANPTQVQEVIKNIQTASPAEITQMVKRIEPNKVLSSADEDAIRKAVNNPALTTVMITNLRNEAIRDFIQHGGRTTGLYKSRDIIALLTDAERAEFGEYIIRYEKYMQFTEI